MQIHGSSDPLSGLAQWLALRTTNQGVPGLRPGRDAVRCGLEQVSYPLLSAGKTQEAVDIRLTWTDCDEAGDYVVPNVLSPRDLVSRPDNMNETVLHTYLMNVFNTSVLNLSADRLVSCDCR